MSWVWLVTERSGDRCDSKRVVGSVVVARIDDASIASEDMSLLDKTSKSVNVCITPDIRSAKLCDIDTVEKLRD